MISRADYLEALVGVTAEDIARDVDSASTHGELYEAVHAALLRVGWPDMCRLPVGDRPLLVRVREARVRVGLTTNEATRTAVAREAEQRLMNERAARRAS